jgi:hypothetical protein
LGSGVGTALGWLTIHFGYGIILEQKMMSTENPGQGVLWGSARVALNRRKMQGQGNSPLFEVCIEDPAGESFPANPDALQDPVTAQLVHDQVMVHHT